jgi:hypothetical protein
VIGHRQLSFLAVAALVAAAAVPARAGTVDGASAIGRTSKGQIIEIDWRPSTRKLQRISVQFTCPGEKTSSVADKTVALGRLPRDGRLRKTFRAAFKPYVSDAGGASGTATITLATTIPSANRAAFKGTVTVDAPGCKVGRRSFKGQTSVT